MRIIAGKYAKRNLHTLKSNATRPTSDKVKGSLFNSLGQFFDGGQVLDLYAGSGALGIEAVSRGYDEAVLVDISGQACQVIRKNVELTKEEERFKEGGNPRFVSSGCPPSLEEGFREPSLNSNKVCIYFIFYIFDKVIKLHCFLWLFA